MPIFLLPCCRPRRPRAQSCLPSCCSAAAAVSLALFRQPRRRGDENYYDFSFFLWAARGQCTLLKFSFFSLCVYSLVVLVQTCTYESSSASVLCKYGSEMSRQQFRLAYAALRRPRLLLLMMRVFSAFRNGHHEKKKNARQVIHQQQQHRDAIYYYPRPI